MATKMKAAVEVMSAAVRTLVVGDRQVTTGVFMQVDVVPFEQIEPWGRVRIKSAWMGDDDHVWVVGKDLVSGRLARCEVSSPELYGLGTNTSPEAETMREQWKVARALEPLVLAGR